MLDCFRGREGVSIVQIHHLSHVLTMVSPFKEFGICWNDSKFSYTSSGRVTVDGIGCGGKFIEDQRGPIKYKFVRVTPTTRRPFVFSTLELTGIFSVTCSEIYQTLFR